LEAWEDPHNGGKRDPDLDEVERSTDDNGQIWVRAEYSGK